MPSILAEMEKIVTPIPDSHRVMDHRRRGLPPPEHKE
jgi:hypothetical protein